MAFLRVAVWMVLLMLCGCSGAASRVDGDATRTKAAVQLYFSADDSPAGFRDAAEAAVREAFAGQDLSFDPIVAERAAVHIGLALEYRNLTGTEFETIWGMVASYLLLTLYPATCVHRSYVLRARISGASGVQRDYEASDNTVAWIWMLQGPRCGEEPSADEIKTETRRLLAGIVNTMREDAALDEVSRGIVRTPSPLVRISANRATAIVEQVMRVERPFLRWAMDDPAANQVADYIVDIHFDVEQGSFKTSRAYLGIATAGLSTLAGGLCSGSRVSLQATVIGPSAERTRSYGFSDRVATHVDSGSHCQTIDEHSRPDVFAALVRELFETLKRDGVLAMLVPGSADSMLPPMVRIESSRGESLVREVTLRAAPFPRYVFGSGPNAPKADYVLHLDLQTGGGGVRPLNATRGLMLSLGIDTLCRPTRFVVQAMLADRAGTSVRSYEAGREFDFSGNGQTVGCTDDERTNPDAVRSLLREIYQRMERDGVARLLSTPVPQR